MWFQIYKSDFDVSTDVKETGVRKSRRSFSMLELDMMDIPCESFPYIVEPYKADHWDLTDESRAINDHLYLIKGPL